MFSFLKDLLASSMIAPLYKKTFWASKDRKRKNTLKKIFLKKKTKIFSVNTLL
jgi:hypothetical protein